VRAFPVRLPSGVRYWTVLDEGLSVVGEADAFLRHVRFGRDGSELTTRAYAGGIALFLRCARSAWHWHGGELPGIVHHLAAARGPVSGSMRAGRQALAGGSGPGARGAAGECGAVRGARVRGARGDVGAGPGGG
jgi:hypothetical protein